MAVSGFTNSRMLSGAGRSVTPSADVAEIRLSLMSAQTASAAAFDCAPVSGWRRMLRDTSIVGASGILCHAIGAVTAVLFRMLLSPAEIGIWQALKMILGYANFANLGVSKGATRDYTIATGRGDEAEALVGLNCAFAVNTLSSIVYGLVPIAVGGWILAGGSSSAWGIGLIAAGLMAVISRYVTFQINVLRCRQAFDTTAWISVWEGVATLALGGACSYLFGFSGLLVGTLLVMVLSAVLVRRLAAVRLRSEWDWTRIRHLATVGGPILLAGCAVTLFGSVDKMMILAYLDEGEFQLGCYSVALLVSTQVFGLGNLFSTVMTPRYGEKYGRTGSCAAVARMAMHATEMQALLVGGVAAAALILAPPVLSILLPDYRSGFESIYRLVPGAVAMTLALPASQYLVAIDRQRRVLATVCAALVAAVAGNHWVLTAGGGIAGAATVTAVCYFVYWLGLSVTAFPGVTSVREWLSHLASVFAVSSGPILVALLNPLPVSAPAMRFCEIELLQFLLAGGAFAVSAFILFKRMNAGRHERLEDFFRRVLRGRGGHE